MHAYATLAFTVLINWNDKQWMCTGAQCIVNLSINGLHDFKEKIIAISDWKKKFFFLYKYQKKVMGLNKKRNAP